MSFHNTTVVMDTGSRNTRVGFAGDASPRYIFPSNVGRSRLSYDTEGLPDIFFGKDAIVKRGISKLTWPVRERFIENWEELEKLWHHAFYKALYTPPEEAKVMHPVHPLMSNKDKEKMTEILFESFAINGLYLGPSPALALYASGRTTGVVLENGFSSCYATPVFEGFPLQNATVTSPLTGAALTDVFQKLLTKIGYSFTTEIEKDLLDRIKTEICYVATDYAAEVAAKSSTRDNKLRYELPDGQHLLLGNEIFQCPETLFQPSLQGFNCPSIVNNIYSSINNCDLDYRHVFYENLVISGGSSLFEGLVNRLCVELRSRVRTWPGVKVKMDALPSRDNATWSGGSILGSLSSYNGFWMTKKEYEDEGSIGVNYKFF